MMWDNGNWFGMGGSGWLFGMVMMIALVALVVWGVSTLSNGRSGATEGPLEILRRRGKYHPEDFARLHLVEPVDLPA